MIRSFSFSKFRTFEGLTEIDFSCKEEDDGFRRTISEGEYNKVMLIYGPMSSGKSTILRALTHPKESNLKIDSSSEVKVFDLDDVTVDQATQEYKNDPAMKRFAERILASVDLGITEFVIEEDNTVIFYHGRHPLGMENESGGTIRLYCILVNMYKGIKSKGLVVWDECFRLHSFLVKHFVKMFYQTEAQLLMVTAVPMEFLSKDFSIIDESQIYFVGKRMNISTVIRMDEIPEARVEDLTYINSNI